MGSLLSKIRSSGCKTGKGTGTFTGLSECVDGRKDVKIVMLGPGGAGKTTILYKLQVDEVYTPHSTLGFNVETLQYKTINFTVWDVGSQDNVRSLRRSTYESKASYALYFQGVQGLVYVVDATDRERMEEAKAKLEVLLNGVDTELPWDTPLLVMANKQDLPGAMNVAEITKGLGLYRLGYMRRKWAIQPCSATTGDGLNEGLEWLSNNTK